EDLIKIHADLKTPILASIGTIEQAEIFDRYRDRLNYCFVDVGPVKECSRESTCGLPMSFDYLDAMLQRLDRSVPYILSGGIRTSKDNTSETILIQEIISHLAYRPPIGIMVGSPISAKEGPARTAAIAGYRKELNETYKCISNK
ncbi:MAG: hypothetical protein HGA85_07940, partial [Nanoarchaeota archaeon]|nr:hypothetical protein [Nanoarchaeota archaeon]